MPVWIPGFAGMTGKRGTVGAFLAFTRSQPWRVNVFIQINTDNHVETTSDHNSRLEEQVRQRLARYEGRITDVEIHVSDVNGTRGGDGDLRCTLEARVNG